MADAEAATGGAATASAGTGESQPAAAMVLAQDIFLLSCSDEIVPNKADIKERVMAAIKAKNMAPLYASLAAKHGWAVDEALLEPMRKANAAAVVAADAAIADARDKFGDVEVYEAQKAKAEAIAATGDKEGAFAAFGAIAERTLSTGQKIDITMAKARLSIAAGDWAEARALVAAAKLLNERGGDWDRRNRLKVYEGLLALAGRDWATASELLLDSVATFTAVELCSYTDFVFYTIIAGLRVLDRPSLKKRLVDSPDVVGVLAELPVTSALMNSLYETRYRDFMVALAGVFPALQRDLFLSKHASSYLRDMRVAGYAQFLQSYKSVTLAGMARTFGVSEGWLDRDLAAFIASGRINAKIDSVSGVIDTTRPDAKSAQYAAVLKHGDALLNKMQRLSRVVAL